jgi:hypothetical protein
VTARIWVEPVRHSDGRPKYNSRGQLYRTVLVAPMARCWSGYLAIVIVSLVPGSCVLIFMASRANWNTFWHTALWFRIWFGVQLHTCARGIRPLNLAAGAALLEGPQSFVPDRTPQLVDILASSAGAWIGLGFAFLAIVISRPARK